MVMGFSGPIHQVGPTEIIGINDAEVAASEYSNTVDFTMDPRANGNGVSGEILSIGMVSGESGSGDPQKPAFDLYIFDEDPNTSAGDSVLAAEAAEHNTLVAVVPFSSADWFSDTVGGFCYRQIAVPFQVVTKLYVVMRPAAGSTAINSSTGDDEFLKVTFWYRRDS